MKEMKITQVCVLTRPHAHGPSSEHQGSHPFQDVSQERSAHNLPGSPLLKATEPRKGLAPDDPIGPSRREGLGSYQHDFWESGWQSYKTTERLRQITGRFKQKTREACQR